MSAPVAGAVVNDVAKKLIYEQLAQPRMLAVDPAPHILKQVAHQLAYLLHRGLRDPVER